MRRHLVPRAMTRLMRFPRRASAPASIFYPLIPDFDCYRSVYSSERVPVAKWVSDHVLTLPMYADLAMEDVDRICSVIKSLRG